MPGPFQNPDIGNLGAQSPNLQPTEVAANVSRDMEGAIAEPAERAARGLDQLGDTIRDVQKRRQKGKLDEDLSELQTAFQATQDPELRKQIQNDPEFKGALEEFKQLQAARQQGRTSTEAVRIRSQQIFKNLANQSPAFREELRQHAAGKLGFDPVGQQMKLAMDEAEEAEADEDRLARIQQETIVRDMAAMGLDYTDSQDRQAYRNLKQAQVEHQMSEVQRQERKLEGEDAVNNLTKGIENQSKEANSEVISTTQRALAQPNGITNASELKSELRLRIIKRWNRFKQENQDQFNQLSQRQLSALRERYFTAAEAGLNLLDETSTLNQLKKDNQLRQYQHLILRGGGKGLATAAVALSANSPKTLRRYVGIVNSVVADRGGPENLTWGDIKTVTDTLGINFNSVREKYDSPEDAYKNYEVEVMGAQLEIGARSDATEITPETAKRFRRSKEHGGGPVQDEGVREAADAQAATARMETPSNDDDVNNGFLHLQERVGEEKAAEVLVNSPKARLKISKDDAARKSFKQWWFAKTNKYARQLARDVADDTVDVFYDTRADKIILKPAGEAAEATSDRIIDEDGNFNPIFFKTEREIAKTESGQIYGVAKRRYARLQRKFNKHLKLGAQMNESLGSSVSDNQQEVSKFFANQAHRIAAQQSPTLIGPDEIDDDDEDNNTGGQGGQQVDITPRQGQAPEQGDVDESEVSDEQTGQDTRANSRDTGQQEEEGPADIPPEERVAFERSPVRRRLKQKIKNKEGFRETPYRDGRGYSIGYGHYMGRNPTRRYITKREADKLMDKDMREHRRGVMRDINVPLENYRIAALTSYAYNAGPARARQRGITQAINEGDMKKAARLIKEGPIASNGRVLQGLVNRRNWEACLFLTGDFDNDGSCGL